MTLILDSGAVSAMARDHEWLALLRKKSKTLPQVPAVVLAEALTGDHRRDHHANRLLKLCLISAVDEPLARRAARLRTLTQRAGTISATDAIVAAFAATQQDPVVITSDPKDLTALVESAVPVIRIETV